MKYYFNHEYSYRLKRENRGGEASFQNSTLKKFLEKSLTGWEPKEALVLGCGMGESCLFLCQKGFNSTGIDISTSAINLAKEELLGEGNEKLPLKFIVMDAISMEFSQDFDLILDDHCLHCLTWPEDRESFLRHTFKYLRPGGKFLLETMVFDHQIRFSEQFLLDENKILWAQTEQENFFDVVAFRHRRYFPFRKIIPSFELEQELIKAGFQIEYFYYCGDLKMEIPGNFTIPMEFWPSILRAICSKR